METCAKYVLETVRWKELEYLADALQVTTNVTTAIWELSGNPLLLNKKGREIARNGLLFCWWFSLDFFFIIFLLANVCISMASIYFVLAVVSMACDFKTVMTPFPEQDTASKDLRYLVMAVSDNFFFSFPCTRCLVGNPSGRSFGDVAFLEHSNLLRNIESEIQIFSCHLRMFVSVNYFLRCD